MLFPCEVRCGAKEAIHRNPDVIAEIRAGKEKAKEVLVGAVMKQSRGRADAAAVRRAIDALML